MNEDITQIGINRFVDLVFQTGIECLKERKEVIMGEAKRRQELGLAPRILKPGEQIRVDPEILKNAISIICECGSRYFQPAVMLYSISALISPIGQELTAQQPALICMECKKPLNLKKDALDLSGSPQKEKESEQEK